MPEAFYVPLLMVTTWLGTAVLVALVAITAPKFQLIERGRLGLFIYSLVAAPLLLLGLTIVFMSSRAAAEILVRTAG